MNIFHVLAYFNLTFILVACNTHPLLPTATAATSPTPTPPAAHYFAPHTADEAQEILTQSERAILEDLDLEMPLSQYTLLYRAAFYAAWNANLYFPDDPRTDVWQWKMAYYAAMGGESDMASSIYIDKITKALNEKNIRIENLPSWFQSGELRQEYMTPHFDLTMQPTNVSGGDPIYLAQLGVQGGIDIPGMMCLVIAKHKDQATVYLAYDGFPDGGFFPTLRYPSYCILEDVTGDRVEEVIADNWSGGHVGTGSLQVIDISTLPPKILPFNSSRDKDVSAWNGTAGKFIRKDGKVQIPMSEKLGQCDIHLTRYYEWNGSWFDLKNVSLERMEGGFSSLEDCRGYTSYFSDKDTVFEKVQILDEAIRVYSPGSDSEKDILEEFRVEKGLTYLFSGDIDKAREVFEEIVNNPFKRDGIWVAPVRDFMKVYQAPSDLYRACAALTACDPNRVQFVDDLSHPSCIAINSCYTEALEYTMANQVSSQSLEDFTSSLQTAGVEIASEGWVDLDNDMHNELWFTIYPPSHRWYDVWIVSGYPNGVQAFPLTSVQTDSPKIKITATDSNHTIIELDDFVKYTWSRDPINNEPSLESKSEWVGENYEVVTADLEEFKRLQSEFYTNNNFVDIHQQLSKIADRNAVCPYDALLIVDGKQDADCANYYYTIGFAAELANDNNVAQKMYETVLEQYPTNPMALLAKKKLNQ